MHYHVKNILGKRFGRLEVIEFSEDEKPYARWLCLCDCGKTKIIKGFFLTNGNTTSCGCYHKEIFNNMKHGMSRHKIYGVWRSLNNRCSNKNDKGYKNYGGRGIICEWDSFEEFKEDMYADYKEGLSLDRIDNNGNYSKENCRWATSIEQNNNTRFNRFITYKGKTMNFSKWCAEFNIKRSTLFNRLNRGWSIERSLNEPIQMRSNKILIS